MLFDVQSVKVWFVVRGRKNSFEKAPGNLFQMTSIFYSKFQMPLYLIILKLDTMKTLPFLFLLSFSVLLLTNCTEPEQAQPASERLASPSELDPEILNPAIDNGVEQRARPRPHSWGDCELFMSVVTPTSLPPNGPFDELYGGTEFLDGIPLISESVPGDQDYNGGRWHMNVLKQGVDPDKYADACSVEDLDLDDFESTSMYFVCPLLPRRGN